MENGVPSFYAMVVNSSGAIVGGDYSSVKSSAQLKTGTKYTLKGSYDGSTLRLYVNGTQVASKAVSGTIKAPDNGNNSERTVMAIGANTTGNETQGTLAKVKVHTLNITNDAGLIAQYDATKNVGAIKDLTSNNDGILYSKTAQTESGSIILDGKNDWIKLSPMAFKTNEVTLDMTFTPLSNTGDTQYLMTNIEGGGVALYISSNNMRPGMMVWVEEKGQYVAALSETPLTLNQKVHLTGTYDGNTIRLYVNGELAASTVAVGTIKVPRNTDKTITTMAIGANPEGNNATDGFANIKVHNASAYNKTYWDVSEAGDSSILAWSEKSNSNGAQKVYIASKGNILANKDSSNLFKYIGYSTKCTAKETITNLGALNTTNVTNMNSMFESTGYNAMTSLNLGSNFYTTNVTSMSYMFEDTGYKAMSTLNLGNNFNTNKLQNMNQMFYQTGYTAMTELNLGSNFDTSKVTNMRCTFKGTGYNAMKTLTLGTKFNTSSATDMYQMFMDCGYTALTSLDLGDVFYTSKVEDMSNMFQNTGRTAMTNLDLGPAFTNIASTNTDIFTATGKEGALVIQAPEAIFKSKSIFKLNTSSSTTISYSGWTINPKYRTEWTQTGTTIDTTNKNIKITLRGRTNNAISASEYTSLFFNFKLTPNG